MPDSGPLLAAQGLACQRGGRWLFKDLSLALNGGEALHLRGANGAGKTSLMRLLAGLAWPDAGQVSRPEALLFVGHHNAQADELTLAENLSFAAALAGQAPTRSVVQQALSQLGVGAFANTPVRRLSQGQRRRGALARLVLPGAPRLWLLDEPHNTLDSAAVALLDAVIEQHCASGGAVLLTGHQGLHKHGLRVLDLT